MKVCTWAEFAALPAGTIFSFWNPSTSADLFAKGETWNSNEGKPIDFWMRSLLPEPGEDGDLATKLQDFETRWGMFQFDQLFAVYGADDLNELIDAAQFAIGLMDVCEHGVPTGDFCKPCNREYKRAAIEFGGEG